MNAEERTKRVDAILDEFRTAIAPALAAYDKAVGSASAAYRMAVAPARAVRDRAFAEVDRDG